MKDPSFYVSSLLELAKASTQERRALWRQAMAALSRLNVDGGPSPLEGLRPDVLVKNVQAALDDGLVDDLDWLAPDAAGVALYTLASALPASQEQRELGRRVLARTLAGNAETFTAIATAMAQSGGKGLGSPAIRARLALVCEVPLAHGINDGPLALALVSRRELAREWVAVPSTRSLPQRRLAAKILERAAREAARRAQMGDSHALRVFVGDTVRTAYNRLLADRESLVWRYVAAARGLCAAWVPELRQQITDSLREGLTPTEWRRAATSLAAMAAVKPDEAMKILQSVIKRGLFTYEDPASSSAFVWGIGRAIESEPEAASKMLEQTIVVAPPEIAEAIVDLRTEYGPSKVVDRASRMATELLKSDKRKRVGHDDGADALFLEIQRDLSAEREDAPLRAQVAAAVDTFVDEGAQAAYAKAREVLESAKAALDALEAVARDDDAEGRAGQIARRTSMAVLRDLDLGLLERNVVVDLVKLAPSVDQARAAEDVLDAVRERFAEWIVTCETTQDARRSVPRLELVTGDSEPPSAKEPPRSTAIGGSPPSDGRPRQPTLRLRRLRALLHLVDGDLGDHSDPAGRAASQRDGESSEMRRTKRLRALWLRTVKALLEHFARDPVPILRRTVLASLARALDAVVRLGVCDIADALLVLAQRIRTTSDFEALAEASMDPDLRHALARYARFLRDSDAVKPIVKTKDDPADSLFPPSLAPDPGSALVEQRLQAFEELANELAPEASARTEALRTVLVRLHQALTAVSKAGSLQGLASSGTSDPDMVEAVETWTSALSQMCAGARARLEEAPPLSSQQQRLLSVAVSRVLSGAETELTEEALGPAIDELAAGLPFGIARLVASILWNLQELPAERPSFVEMKVDVAELPPWLTARRTIGGFYVVRSLGQGGTASVFIVNRVEDRHDPNAERFALKVPDYNATAARSVSQDEFLKLFREEASALIMLPNHANLARFVTFDLSARPLPILVMELVEGLTLERVIEARGLDVKRCLKALDDVLAGLEAMHHAGLGHLDLKPSNVIMRNGQQAVLVDFGLSGRKIRPGCGTGPYGAPEVWGVAPEGVNAGPMAADIYAFGCVAYEMLTGSRLFDAPNEVAQIAMHVAHDGKPEPLKRLLDHPEAGPIAEILVSTLRRDPRQRPTAEELRRELRSVVSMASEAKWPVAVA